MKFSTRQDIDAPVEHVFARATDFARFERLVRRRGVKLTRVSDGDVSGQGLCWQARFPYRGRDRKVSAEMRDVVTNERLCMAGASSGMEYEFEVEFVALSPTKSRMVVGLDVRPKSLPARLLIQSLKLGKSGLDSRFAERVRKFADFVQDSGQ